MTKNTNTTLTWKRINGYIAAKGANGLYLIKQHDANTITMTYPTITTNNGTMKAMSSHATINDAMHAAAINEAQ